jgi:hypothetical protein
LAGYYFKPINNKNMIKQLHKRPHVNFTSGTVADVINPGSGQPIQARTPKVAPECAPPAPPLKQQLGEVEGLAYDFQMGEQLGGDGPGGNFVRTGDMGILLALPSSFIHRRFYGALYAKLAPGGYYKLSVNCYYQNTLVAKFPMAQTLPLNGVPLPSFAHAFTSYYQTTTPITDMLDGSVPSPQLTTWCPNCLIYEPRATISGVGGFEGYAAQYDVLFPKTVTLEIDTVKVNCDDVSLPTDCRVVIAVESFRYPQH